MPDDQVITPSMPQQVVSTPVETPVVVPVSEATPAATVASEPIAETPVAESTTAPTPAEDTLLTLTPVVEKQAEVPEIKPDGAKDTPPEGQQKEDGAQSDEPAPLPSYDDWSLPEELTVDKDRIGQFNQMLGEFQVLTKADQAKTQEFGQKLVDYHVSELKQALEYHQKANYQFWEKQQSDWKTAFENDPEIGGNRKETTLKAANEMIRLHGGTAEQQKSLVDSLVNTGMANNPDLVRLLANIGRSFSEGRPVPASKPAPTVTSKVARRYGGM